VVVTVLLPVGGVAVRCISDCELDMLVGSDMLLKCRGGRIGASDVNERRSGGRWSVDCRSGGKRTDDSGVGHKCRIDRKSLPDSDWRWTGVVGFGECRCTALLVVDDLRADKA
jgi:hypothetical protein